MNIETYNTPDDALAAASKLDSHGEWAAAIDLYRQAAERWPEQVEYIQGCIDSITEKQSLQNGSCGPPGPEQVDRGPFYRCGCCCLILALIMAGMFASTLWAVWETRWRAERIHQAMKPGDSFEEVESLLTGRHFCFYQVKRDEEWASVARSEFIEIIDSASMNGSPELRLHLAILGMSPYRVSFNVELDRAGNVTNVTEPYGWD